MKLADWMRHASLKDVALAAKLGCDRTHVTKLRLGTAEPSMRLAGAIVALSNGQVTYADLRLVQHDTTSAASDVTDNHTIKQEQPAE